MLTLIQGPAGGAKSQLARELLDAGEVDVQVDATSLWAALVGAVRGPDGRYPTREDDDPGLPVALYMMPVAVRRSLEDGRSVVVSTSRAGQEARWRAVAEDAGASFSVRTVDPGEDVVRARLAEADGNLSAECDRAIRRWYR